MNQHQPLEQRPYIRVVLLGALLCFIACGGKTTTTETDGPEETSKPLYTKGTVLHIASGGYSYLARVTAETLSDAEEVPIYVFSEPIREKIGDTIPIGDTLHSRKKPDEGWGTRLVAAEYFDGVKWNFEWNVQEMGDHYLLPEKFQGIRRIEFTNVRFPIPLRK